jgi:plastocyanin
MDNRITASLVVCVAAAGVAVGALALDSDDPSTATDGPAVVSADPQTGATGSGGNAATANDAGGTGYGNSAGNDAGADAGGGGQAGATLGIQDFTFSNTSVAPGGQVVVDNGDGATHTVTADDGEFDSGEVPGGSTSTFQAPDEAGSYGFACEIHPDMTGTLTVG